MANYVCMYEVQLQGFCDASGKTYAAIMYSKVPTPSIKSVALLLAAIIKVQTVKQLNPDR